MKSFQAKWQPLYTWLAAVALIVAFAFVAYAISGGDNASHQTADKRFAKIISRSAQNAQTAAETAAPVPTTVPNNPAPAPRVPAPPARATATTMPSQSTRPAMSSGGHFILNCFKLSTLDGIPRGECNAGTQDGFTGRVNLSCANHDPGLQCRFDTAFLDVAPDKIVRTFFTLDWPSLIDGQDYDLVIQGSAATQSESIPLTFTKADVAKPAPAKLPNGDFDYSAEPHIRFSCDRPTEIPIKLLSGESTTVTCTVSSYLGFTNRVAIDCAAAWRDVGPKCTPDQPYVVPPPDGSVPVVITISLPPNEIPGKYYGNAFRIIAFRNNVFTEPSQAPTYTIDDALYG